eukprot:snap_masked-scaffold_4-processed-gene-5.30-mRNA-1 protein AED:1.00 eAED:1.00 QI:0/-1/0/0/-1/1/1/0/125
MVSLKLDENLFEKQVDPLQFNDVLELEPSIISKKRNILMEQTTTTTEISKKNSDSVNTEQLENINESQQGLPKETADTPFLNRCLNISSENIVQTKRRSIQAANVANSSGARKLKRRFESENKDI